MMRKIGRRKQMTAKFKKLIADPYKVKLIIDAHTAGMSLQDISAKFYVGIKHLYELFEMHNVAYTKTVRRHKSRNPELERRDRMFEESCNSCLRRPKCTFRQLNNTRFDTDDDGGGPEAVCIEIVENATHNCWACLRRKGATCHFKCCFYNQDFSVIPLSDNANDDIFIPSGHQHTISSVYAGSLYDTDNPNTNHNTKQKTDKKSKHKKYQFNQYPQQHSQHNNRIKESPL